MIVAKYLSDTVFQAGWALASLDLLGSPGVMIRSTLTGVKDLVVMPYDGTGCILLLETYLSTSSIQVLAYGITPFLKYCFP